MGKVVWLCRCVFGFVFRKGLVLSVVIRLTVGVGVDLVWFRFRFFFIRRVLGVNRVGIVLERRRLVRGRYYYSG